MFKKVIVISVFFIFKIFPSEHFPIDAVIQIFDQQGFLKFKVCTNIERKELAQCDMHMHPCVQSVTVKNFRSEEHFITQGSSGINQPLLATALRMAWRNSCRTLQWSHTTESRNNINILPYILFTNLSQKNCAVKEVISQDCYLHYCATHLKNGFDVQIKAYLNDLEIGYADCILQKDHDTYNLMLLAVKQGYRNKGYGKKLFHAALNVGKYLSYKNMCWSSLPFEPYCGNIDDEDYQKRCSQLISWFKHQGADLLNAKADDMGISVEKANRAPITFYETMLIILSDLK